MYQDKTLVCKECGQELLFLLVNRSFMLPKVFRMNRDAVRPAERRESNNRGSGGEKDKCMRRSAPNAVRKRKFLLSLPVRNLSIAVSVIRPEGNLHTLSTL